jgi:hypothetical protein
MMKGAKEVIDTLKKLAEKFPDRVAAAIYQEAQIVMTESKRRCPVASDGGILRASGQVSLPVRKGKNISVTLSYGGAADAYAIAVHEHLSSHSPPSWVTAEDNGHPVQWTTPGTGPKFLEGPINEAAEDMAARIAKRVQLGKEE